MLDAIPIAHSPGDLPGAWNERDEPCAEPLPGLLAFLRLDLLLRAGVIAAVRPRFRSPGHVRARALLHHMRQFMSQQPLPAPGSGGQCAGAEDDVTADGKGLGIDVTRGPGGSLIGVHAHAAEVVAQSGLHQRPEGRLERRTR